MGVGLILQRRCAYCGAGGTLPDTSATLWTQTRPERLSAAARRAFEVEETVLNVAFYWEAVIQAKIGF
jgi:PIN domain nuclease of toxin-antitoxin system